MTPRLAGSLGLGLGAAAFVAAAALYSRLPDAMVVHWSLAGRPDGVLGKPVGPFVFPAMVTASALLAWILPAASPAKFRIEPFARSFATITLALTVFLAWTMAATFAGALDLPVPVGRLVIGGVGPMLVVIGNLMGKLTPNFFVGVRTPWTLADEEVWGRTHRLAGRLMVLAGLLVLAAAIVGPQPLPILAVILCAALLPVLYSFVLHRRLQRGGR